jgi:hypothetical protein
MKSAYELAVREEMMDPIMQPVIASDLYDLQKELKRMRSEYRGRVARLTDLCGSDDVLEGDILIGLQQLADHWWRSFATFAREKETFHCCLTLHLCTKYLADGRVRDPHRPSKDERFIGVYESNWQFRRDWVAFLSHVVAYVEKMYSIETDADYKLYLHRQRLSGMTNVYRARWWEGYDWAAIKAHIETAQEQIKNEPPSAWQKMRKWAGFTGAGLQDGDDMGEMLAELQTLSV